VKLFNFFLILSGVIIGAVPAVRQIAPDQRTVAFVPLLLVVIAFIFWRFEERTRCLVKHGEDALKFLDKEWPVERLKDRPHYLCLFERAKHFTDKVQKKWWAILFVPVTYAASFRMAYVLIAGVGLWLALWELRSETRAASSVPVDLP
jgi:hypothetical protein